MEFTAQQIADFLKGEIQGDSTVKVSSFSKIEEGKPGTLSFLSNPKYSQYIYESQASIILVNKDFVGEKEIKSTLIRVEDAYQSLAFLLSLVDQAKPKKKGISPLAFISASATLADNAYVAAFAYIGDNVKIGENATIYANVTIEDDVVIGDNVIIYSGVNIYNSCVIGNNNIIHAGVVIGSDGFGFAPSEDGSYKKIPQLGNVVIEDDVEIGANSTIDRATMGSTYIRKGVKLDNLVQVAHNVEINQNTVIAAQSGVAGSTKVGKQCIIGGQVGIAGHIQIADGTILGGNSGVANTIKTPNQTFQGAPIMPISNFRRASIVYKNLPEIQKLVYEMQKKIEELEKKIQQ